MRGGEGEESVLSVTPSQKWAACTRNALDYRRCMRGRQPLSGNAQSSGWARCGLFKWNKKWLNKVQITTKLAS